MKIISWNCNMAFRKKAPAILKSHPDILIIQECEHLDKIDIDSWDIKPTSTYWYGKNPHKGVAIYTFNNYRIDSTNIEHDERFEFIIPLRITGNNISLYLYAVWTQKTYNAHYTSHIYRAVEHYADRMRESDSIIIGDLNSNSIWDKPRRETNHSNLVSFLEHLNIFSAYHHFYNEQQGKEGLPTLYFQRNKNKLFHIDYCFASKNLLSNSLNVEIGKYADFISHSDHMPLFVDI